MYLLGSFPRKEKKRNLLHVGNNLQSVVIVLFRGKRHVGASCKAFPLVGAIVLPPFAHTDIKNNYVLHKLHDFEVFTLSLSTPISYTLLQWTYILKPDSNKVSKVASLFDGLEIPKRARPVIDFNYIKNSWINHCFVPSN